MNQAGDVRQNDGFTAIFTDKTLWRGCVSTEREMSGI